MLCTNVQHIFVIALDCDMHSMLNHFHFFSHPFIRQKVLRIVYIFEFLGRL